MLALELDAAVGETCRATIEPDMVSIIERVVLTELRRVQDVLVIAGYIIFCSLTKPNHKKYIFIRSGVCYMTLGAVKR